ncbi:MAG: flagellar hook capping FlgD N-terminal domain-containing protein [Clostridia bacterium]|nr:flagellar hook capping FlgD N-terminal domain-containing protein [Clostridia bacterium]
MAVATVNSDGTLNTKASSIYNSTSDSTYNNGLDKDAFLQLLVAEMQHQDPLEPSSNTDYVAQLATFTQVEEMQNMANSMAQNQASSLIGKTVIMNTLTASGSASYVGGVVDRIVNESGKTYIGIDGSLYDIADLNSVLNDDYYSIVNGSTQGNEEKDAASDNNSASDKQEVKDNTSSTDK